MKQISEFCILATKHNNASTRYKIYKSHKKKHEDRDHQNKSGVILLPKGQQIQHSAEDEDAYYQVLPTFPAV